MKRALLVENEPEDYFILSKILSKLGFELVFNDDGSNIVSFNQAIIALDNIKNISLALLDIQLAETEKNGIDLAEYIFTKRLQINVVFTTMYFSPENRTRLSFLGKSILILPKIKGKIDSESFMFILENYLNKPSTFDLRFNDILLPVHVIKLNHNIREQLIIADRDASLFRIIRNEVALIVTGKYGGNEIPKDHVLLISSDMNHSFISRISLSKIIKNYFNSLDFIRINSTECINLNYILSVSSDSGNNFAIFLKNSDRKFKVSRTYRQIFKTRLELF